MASLDRCTRWVWVGGWIGVGMSGWVGVGVDVGVGGCCVGKCVYCRSLCAYVRTCMHSCPCHLQVRHKGTGKEMVMKKMVRCTEEAKKGFLKEVSTGVASHLR